MSIQSALDCINLVGKTVRPTHGSERWAFANGNPRSGIVTDVHIRNLNFAHVVVDFGDEIVYLCPFELDVLTH